ncbi:hypothetical protein RclHR1_08580003 [Rhizophagus clarus]|uniref:RING-type domain-containing protein n=1 Tax=Rhizophagus clarus TaxID=94130 RepID=A0A2Z6S1I1_9GLOM|nr:hypothetical protein RclHR1_08580003 [Rhizophagus clarus]
MSDHEIHEPYTCYNTLIAYLRSRTNRSYRGFLELNRDVIASSLSSDLNWNDLDNAWSSRFLDEAERTVDFGGKVDYVPFFITKQKVALLTLLTLKQVESEQNGNGLKEYWKQVIKEHIRNSAQIQLKGFAYKIIFYENLERIPEEFNPQVSYLCEICQKEIFPQLSQSITILTCRYLFHRSCIEHSQFSCCPICQEKERDHDNIPIDEFYDAHNDNDGDCDFSFKHSDEAKENNHQDSTVDQLIDHDLNRELEDGNNGVGSDSGNDALVLALAVILIVDLVAIIELTIIPGSGSGISPGSGTCISPGSGSGISPGSGSGISPGSGIPSRHPHHPRSYHRINNHVYNIDHDNGAPVDIGISPGSGTCISPGSGSGISPGSGIPSRHPHRRPSGYHQINNHDYNIDHDNGSPVDYHHENHYNNQTVMGNDTVQDLGSLEENNINSRDKHHENGDHEPDDYYENMSNEGESSQGIKRFSETAEKIAPVAKRPHKSSYSKIASRLSVEISDELVHIVSRMEEHVRFLEFPNLPVLTFSADNTNRQILLDAVDGFFPTLSPIVDSDSATAAITSLDHQLMSGKMIIFIAEETRLEASFLYNYVYRECAKLALPSTPVTGRREKRKIILNYITERMGGGNINAQKKREY